MSFSRQSYGPLSLRTWAVLGISTHRVSDFSRSARLSNLAENEIRYPVEFAGFVVFSGDPYRLAYGTLTNPLSLYV